MTKFQ
jgi:hypothetical protein